MRPCREGVAAATVSCNGAIARHQPADRRRRRRRRAAAGRHRPAHAAGDLAGARRAHRRARVSQGRDACSAPARSSSAAPTTSSPRIPQAERAGGVVAFSSGNHAQGVAAAARLLGMPAVIVMPSDAPRPKRERTAAFGAEVVLYDRDSEDRQAIARDIAEKRGAALVPPYDDPFVIAGQGTAGREIVEDLAAHRAHARRGGGAASGGGLTAGDCARRQGAGAAGAPLHRRARGLRRPCPLVQERTAREERGADRHDLRCADGADARRAHFRHQPHAGRPRAPP